MENELISAIKAAIAEELAPIKAKISSLESSVVKIDDAVNRMETKIDTMATENSEDVLSLLRVLDKKLDSIKKDVEFTYQKTSMNELEINRLKHQ